MKKVCVVGASGKLGQYMVQHALDRGYDLTIDVGGPTPPGVSCYPSTVYNVG